MKILFVLPVTSQPRFSKRIKAYIDKGFKVKVASFERVYFNKNTLPDGVQLIKLGKIEHGNYLKRLPLVIFSIRKIMPEIKSSDFVYFFTPEIFVISSLIFSNKKFIYEIGDIRIIKNKFLKILFEYFYGYCLKQSFKVVVTSEKFKSYLSKYYKLNESKFSVVENKLEADFFDNPTFQFHKINQSYIIGIVGFFRYRNIIEFLNEFVKIKSDIKVHLYGDGPLLNEILTFVDQGNIIYFGQFKYPDDIPSIYNSIDLSFTMYDSDDLNVKLALPNKLYESIYFNVPILVSKNTFLSEKVDSGGIGFSWDQLDYYGLIQYLTSKRFISDYNSLESNFLNFDKNQIINETNHTRP